MSTERLFGSASHSDDEQWITVSDLMAGLMVIFLFIAITYIRPIVEVQNAIRAIVVTWNESELEIYEALRREFEEDLPKWNAELDPDLTIRFKSPEVLFDSGEATLKREFKEILFDFFSRYLRILSRFQTAMEEVRIEGHTSSVWLNARSPDQAYFLNMELSQARTRSVLEFCLGLRAVFQNKEWARGLITANGLSSSRLIMVGGNEDKTRSRRVEFRIRTNTKERIVQVLETLKK